MALLLALSVPALARNPPGGNPPGGNPPGGNPGGNTVGAPGPLVGAGLPAAVLLIGGGVYWLVRRRKRTS